VGKDVGSKSDARNPKSETNPKYLFRIFKTREPRPVRAFKLWSFEFVLDFELRICAQLASLAQAEVGSRGQIG
jgi:hypothetical protein